MTALPPVAWVVILDVARPEMDERAILAWIVIQSQRTQEQSAHSG